MATKNNRNIQISPAQSRLLREAMDKAVKIGDIRGASTLLDTVMMRDKVRVEGQAGDSSR